MFLFLEQKTEDEGRRRKNDNHQILRFFLFIPAFPADAAAVNLKGLKTLSANSLITFFIEDHPVFSNKPRSLPRNPPNCTILDN